MTTNTNGNTPAVHPTAETLELMKKPELISLAVSHGCCSSKTAARTMRRGDLISMLTHYFTEVFTPADAFVEDDDAPDEMPPLTCDCDGECDDKYGVAAPNLPKPIAHGFANGASDQRGVRAAQARRRAKNRARRRVR